MSLGKKAVPLVVTVLVVSWVLLARLWATKTEYINGQLPEMSVEDLFVQSTLAVRGSVTGSGTSFVVESPSGMRLIYTDYPVTVTETVRGTAGETVTLRMPGGTVGRLEQIYTIGPELRTGEEYLLFLYQPGMGGGFNTAGDYYYILGLTQGVLSSADGITWTDQNDREMNLPQALAAYGDIPIDRDYARRAFVAAQEDSLAQGKITREEYDQRLAELNTYATIVTEE